MKKATYAIIPLLIAVLLFACTPQPTNEAGQIPSDNNANVEQEFLELASAWAESIISGEYEYAIEMPYYIEEHEYIRNSYRAQLETDGTPIIGYEIFGVAKLDDNIYQLDGLLFSEFEYTEIFIPFYFYMEDEWHYAMNEFEVPGGLLVGLEYKSFDGSLDPDDTIIFELD